MDEIHNWESWIGTDESGKGDYFGPLVVAGVFVNLECRCKFFGNRYYRWQKDLKFTDQETCRLDVE